MSRTLGLSRVSLAAVLFLFTSSSLIAQTLSWTGRDGGVLTNPYTELGAPGRGVQSQSMVGDANGNVYVIGTLQGGGLREDVVVLKFDANGVRQWAATYDSGSRDQAYGLALDGNGDIIVLGREVPASWFVMKLDGGDGSRQWIRTIGTGSVRFNALAVDSFGNTYVAGFVSGFRVLKLDAAGVQQWSVASGAGEAQVIEVDSGGNVYAAGSGFKVVKYDGAGVQQWLSAYGGSGAMSVYDLDLDDAGNLYLTGYQHLATGEDMLTLKLDGTGAQQWEAAYDGGSWDLGLSLSVDGSGNVYVTGQSDTPTQGDFLTLKYNPAGALLWSASDDTGGGYDLSYDIAVDGAGNATVTGRSQAGPSGGFHTVQYDPFGATRWEATWDGPDEDYAQAVLSDPFGNVYVAGTSMGTNADLRVIKYDAGGSELWSVSEGVTNDAADVFGAADQFFQTRKTLAVDPAGGAWLAGSSFNGLSWDVRLTRFDGVGVRQWTAVLDTGRDDEPVAVAADPSGDVYVLAFSLNPPVNYDFLLAKYDAAGTLLWRAIYDGGGLDLPGDVALDGAGNVVVIGRTLQGPNPYDFLTLKYDAAGTLLWSATYDGGRTDLGTEAEIDGAGNVIVSGSSQGPDLEWDTTTLEYDPAGNLVWSALDSHLNLFNMILGADGNVYLTGDDHGIAIVKYDGAGARQWRSSYSSSSQDFAYSIAADAAGNLYAAGVTYNGMNFDLLTLALDASGATRWAATYDGGNDERGQSLALDGSGNAFVTGYRWNGINDDALLVKYDTAGTWQWVETYDNGSNDYGYAVALDSLGGVYVGGDSVGSTTGADLLLLKYTEQTQMRTAGFVAAASSLSEKANSAALSVVLTTSDGLPSAGAVTVGYTAADGTALAGQDYTASTGTLSFPAGTPSGSMLTVTVPLIDDSGVEGDESFTVQLGNPTGVVLATAVHTVTILDNDKAGFDVRPRSDLRTDEDGGSDTFTIVLTSHPSAGVSLALSSDDLTEGTVFPATLLFTPADWNLPRTVTVTGVDDLEVDGNVSYNIVLQPATSADPAYESLDADDVKARNQDNDRGRRP